MRPGAVTVVDYDTNTSTGVTPSTASATVDHLTALSRRYG
ncbi:hypothetical protein HNR10_000560 [Nocardiopsis aegyptia]|uniref:Uncharacterized protein n=1 Tax=Nocardiopsis aegyptia TaxID=220378 RepID=A0A7Z0EIU3_9ACTN|nr:hypothetical protein [Nocardiopsis aegyptia]